MYSPDKAIAVLRIVVGVWFLKAVWTKLTLGFFAAVYGTSLYPHD